MAGFVAVFTGFEDGTDDRAVGIGMLVYPAFRKSEDFFGVTRPNVQVGSDDKADFFLDRLGIPGFTNAKAVYFASSQSIDHFLGWDDHQI